MSAKKDPNMLSEWDIWTEMIQFVQRQNATCYCAFVLHKNLLS